MIKGKNTESQPFSPLTKANHVPDEGFRGGAENHVDQPEGVEDFDTHPGKWGEQGVVEKWRHPGAHTLLAHIGQDRWQEEDEVEGGQRGGQTQVDGNGLLLGSLAARRARHKPLEWHTMQYITR